MSLAMPRPMKRSGTSFHQFIQRIPADIKSKVRGTTLVVPVGDATIRVSVSDKAHDVRVSLRTRDPQEAKARQGRVVAYLEGVWRSHREGPRSLPYREVVALSGLLYRDLTTRMEDEPGDAAIWQHVARLKQKALDEGKLEEWLGGTVDDLLSQEALSVDTDSRKRLLTEAAKALTDAATHLERNARGDFQADPKAGRFPERMRAEPTPKTKTTQRGSQTLQSHLDAMAQERRFAPKTVSEWSRSVNRLTDFAGTSVADEISPQHIIDWTDTLVAAGLSAKTINDTYLASIKALFAWTKAKQRIPSNPALEVPSIRRRDEEEDGKRGFTMAEAKVVLSAALKESNDIRRWVPWVLALTGARAGEIVQLRKQDVKQDPDTGIWHINITPRAGRLKNRVSARVVPLHPQLIDMGFLQWVERQPADRLFYVERPNEAQDGKRSTKSVAINRLGDWVRGLKIEGVTTGDVSPNHGWRHRMSTELTILDVNDVVRRRILGQQLQGQDKRYVGSLTLERLQSAISLIPPFRTPKV